MTPLVSIREADDVALAEEIFGHPTPFSEDEHRQFAELAELAAEFRISAQRASESLTRANREVRWTIAQLRRYSPGGNS